MGEGDSITVLQCYIVIPLQCYSFTMLLYCNVSVAVLQGFSVTVIVIVL